MKKVISIVLAVLVMGLILPGCAQGQVNELKAQIAGKDAQIAKQQAQIAESNSEIEKLKEENLKLQKEVDKLEEQTTAKIEIAFEPDPVTLKEEEWRWRVILKEVKGFGVKLNDITMQIHHGEDGIVDSWSDKSWLDAIDHYLPAYGSVHSDRHVGYQQSVTHVIFIVTGIDDNGHSIAVENRVELLPQIPGSAKIEITFSSNPLPCEDGYWTWRTIYTEVNGIGVTFNNFKSEMYRNTRLLHTYSHDRAFIAGKLPDAYLPAYGSEDWGGHIPCQNITHIVKTMSGIDDNGNEITAEARLDLKR